MPELYPDPVDGPFTVPSGTDIADGPQAFRDFADSLGGATDVLDVVEITGDHTATEAELGGLFSYVGAGAGTLTITAGLAEVGACFAASNASDDPDATVEVITPDSTLSLPQFSIASFTQVATDVWVTGGAGGGGGSIDASLARIESNPTTVSGETQPVQFNVKLNDGSDRILWVLPGNTGMVSSLHLTEEAAEKVSEKVAAKVRGIKVPADFDGDPITLLPKKDREALEGLDSPVLMNNDPKDQAVYEIGLGKGLLYGVMVASGGSGGGANNTGGYGGGGGAGGVVGYGAQIQVPITEAGTYRFHVGSTTPQGTAGTNQLYENLNGQHTWIADANDTVVTAAIGGGHGATYWNGYLTAGQGGSGGGGVRFGTGVVYRSMDNGRGAPGQGHGGSLEISNGGAGGGYSAGPSESTNDLLTIGGDGFDLITALDLDPSNSQVQTFMGIYTGYDSDGWIAGGGGGFGAGDVDAELAGGKGGGGGGWYNGRGPEDIRGGKDFTGGGGGGTFNTTACAAGGAGCVFLLGEA